MTKNDDEFIRKSMNIYKSLPAASRAKQLTLSEVIPQVTCAPAKKKTYAQDWKNYNVSQQKEKELFMQFLHDITINIRSPAYTFGRPTLPLGDMTYAVIFKVYSTYSGRRFTSDMKMAKEKGMIDNHPHYNSIFAYFQKSELTPLLEQMVQITSLPLKTTETVFAADSTGFGTSRFQRWYSYKYGKEINSRRWVKCHFMTGVKSNIITGVTITSETGSDSPELPSLVYQTAQHFELDEVSADKAYSSRDNMDCISEAGATPYIPFKINATGKARGSVMWKKMYHYFMLHHDEFMQAYHARSNAESTADMLKTKFGGSVRSRLWTAQVNEVLAKVICHNIVCVIHEMHGLGIKPDFTYQTPDSKITESKI